MEIYLNIIQKYGNDELAISDFDFNLYLDFYKYYLSSISFQDILEIINDIFIYYNSDTSSIIDFYIGLNKFYSKMQHILGSYISSNNVSILLNNLAHHIIQDLILNYDLKEMERLGITLEERITIILNYFALRKEKKINKINKDIDDWIIMQLIKNTDSTYRNYVINKVINRGRDELDKDDLYLLNFIQNDILKN